MITYEDLCFVIVILAGVIAAQLWIIRDISKENARKMEWIHADLQAISSELYAISKKSEGNNGTRI